MRSRALSVGAVLVGWLLAPVTAGADFGHHEPGSAGDAEAALARAQQLSKGRGVRTGFELTPALKELVESLPELDRRDRRRAHALLARPTDGQFDPYEDGYSVPEHAPHCTDNFCIHWVESTADAPDPTDANGQADGDGVPDYVETMATVVEQVHAVENGELAWREPKGDGTRGGDVDKTDVYIKELGGQGLFGYSAPDPDQVAPGELNTSLHSFLVMDNDYQANEFPDYPSPLEPLQVTMAHEYNHVLQFTYDALQDTWMLESTAVWMEDKVYDHISDYLQYLPRWRTLTHRPLTRYDSDRPTDPGNSKVYGSGVWNRWIEEHYGQEAIRGAWERSQSTRPASFGPAAYSAGIRSRGGRGFMDSFARFAVDTAEWRTSNSPFEEGASFPDVRRRGRARVNGDPVRKTLDHTAYALIDVPRTSARTIKLRVTLPRGTAGAIALVGRTGDAVTGVAVSRLRMLSQGGRRSVVLAGANRFDRITAVIVNTSVRQRGYSQSQRDWRFTRDDQPFTARVTRVR
jgi:hypothetical protein